MSENTLMDTATNTEGSPDSSAAPATSTAPAAPEANAAQQQQAAESSASSEPTNPGQAEQPNGDQESKPAEQLGAPEKYEFAAPEGVQLDDTTMAQFSEVAKELNLPQEAAQKVLDKMGPVMAQRQAEMLTQLSESWSEATKADKELGGDKLQQNLAVANKALNEFGTPELRKLLNESGLANNSEVIRLLYRAGKSISEDKFVSGGVGGPAGSRTYANALYPNQ